MSTTTPKAPSRRARRAAPDPGATVLFDAPGPVARRNAFVFSLVGAVLVVAVVVVAVLRLADRGQFKGALWAPLLDPSDKDFQQVWKLIGTGLGNTLRAAVIAIVLSLVIGTVIALLRLSLGRVGRVPVVALIELLRGLPVVITILLVYTVVTSYRVNLGFLPGGRDLWILVIGLTLYNCVIIAEIVRAGVVSLPRGQREAALAVGLTNQQAMRSILLPQAFRVMLPSLISQLIVVLKDTSLISLIGGYIELLKQGGLLIQNLGNPIQVYVVIGIIYILINYTLGKLAEYVQRRSSRSSASGRVPIVDGATGTATV
ncbi:amino acid ABC transporter permease [Rhodococcus antarcticus]|jgi:glutamate transport system permease protein|uniref:Amino acid ABC transporter permease n=1 Tax=Rhodococcus antarcticus TaxID=2987751 RepID=A0ABY6P2I8_9NOCA|nr:amino acid ABC transporter permease [Rhodococcus antarcticus]UZJ25847.1 amino acid ABC transporter permease [Rhodococcus antarcticus]